MTERAPAPKVSVLLPVHNGEAYLESAVRSAMEQTLREIEILVVDDGSTDSSPEILARLAAEDPRIRVERMPENVGLVRALNHGFDLARGEYLARHDADDLCEPERLERQARYMDAHPDIAVLGCSARHIDAEGRVLKTSIRPHDPFTARWTLRFAIPFRHPTFMFRRAAVAERYRPENSLSEDLEILIRISARRKLACLPDLLLRYRQHAASVSARHFRRQVAQGRRCCEDAQRADLDPEIYAALAPARDAFFDLRRLSSAELGPFFRGMSLMAEADSRRSPAHRAWIWRQTAQLAAWALQHGGFSTREVLRAFLAEGRIFLPALVMRYLETARRLPGFLRSDPRV